MVVMVATPVGALSTIDDTSIKAESSDSAMVTEVVGGARLAVAAIVVAVVAVVAAMVVMPASKVLCLKVDTKEVLCAVTDTVLSGRMDRV